MYQGQGVFKNNPSKYEESIIMLLSVAVQKTSLLFQPQISHLQHVYRTIFDLILVNAGGLYRFACF